MGKFEVIGGAFARNGVEHRVLSGALHYFRVLPPQWPHRLRMLRAMGLNCVETYVPWNLHEPRRGTYRQVEQLEDFLWCAQEEGLDAIVRPGPYICAEWDNGGLPHWVPGRIRSCDPDYLAAVDEWFDVLIPRIAEHQITRDGNVILVQVENEYGSYGSDQVYLKHLADGLQRRGIDVPLFTSDGPTDLMLTGGTIPGVLATVNFGSEPEAAFKTFRQFRPGDPLFCMEFWCGWFSHWGGEHVTRDPADAADVLRRILDAGASVNLYMAHGGTNFGTWAGANRGEPMHSGELLADVTSYDYDAPIDERGAPTEKFWLFREIFQSIRGVPETPPLLDPVTVTLGETVGLLDFMGTLPTVESPAPPTFEELGLRQGLVLYRCGLRGPRSGYPLKMNADYARVFADGEEVPPGADVAVNGDRAEVAILVESLGRVNYGPLLGQSKGLAGGVVHGQQYVHGFSAAALALDELPELLWDKPYAGPGPAFSRGWADVSEPRDAYLSVDGGKGYVWVNGFLLGRYWTIGPQRSLYVPWPLLKPGRNEVVVLSLEGEPVTRVELGGR